MECKFAFTSFAQIAKDSQVIAVEPILDVAGGAGVGERFHGEQEFGNAHTGGDSI